MKSLVFVLLGLVCFSLVLSGCLNTPEEGISFLDQWKKDTTAIGIHLRTNNINALTDASGVRFIIDQPGTGFNPFSTRQVTFKYVGKFLNGTQFDAGTLTGSVTNYIPGFQIGLSLMQEGSKARVFIPSGYAYGEGGSSNVPPNSNLMFELELLDVIRTTAENTQLGTDTVAIDAYLTTNTINAIKDPSGIRYLITQQGTGAVPGLYDKVQFNYEGKLLTTGQVFFTGSGTPSSTFDSRVINYLHGFQAALTKLPVGSKATVYIPSVLGFGSQANNNGTVPIPANSNLIYTMELVAIKN